jgi:hypothetical protein
MSLLNENIKEYNQEQQKDYKLTFKENKRDGRWLKNLRCIRPEKAGSNLFKCS